jgi:hypothetical protein
VDVDGSTEKQASREQREPKGQSAAMMLVIEAGMAFLHFCGGRIDCRIVE